ncbi:35107_t:CDS:2, partial [Racocetra persica]
MCTIDELLTFNQENNTDADFAVDQENGECQESESSISESDESINSQLQKKKKESIRTSVLILKQHLEDIHNIIASKQQKKRLMNDHNTPYSVEEWQ